MQIHPYVSRLQASVLTTSYGRVKKIGATYVEADGPAASIGDICTILPHSDTEPDFDAIDAEVVGVEEHRVILIPFQQNVSISPECRVVARDLKAGQIAVGNAFAGRAVNALGRPIDQRGEIAGKIVTNNKHSVSAPLDRLATDICIPTGIRAIDTLLTLAKGQRVGIFAAAGVGKTTLIEQIARQVKADRTIICLVGERGQEVQAIWKSCQKMDNPEKFTLVASTSDESAPLRVRAPDFALKLAEHWRSKGEHVLMILDSATRMAMALREVGLAAGEPPTVRAYTPNVFAAIPRFVERCGALNSGGAITAVMTVLAESEDVDDPVCEMMKAVLDGHIVLSRTLAEQGQFPAIDIGRSISRQASKVLSERQLRNSVEARKMLALYEESSSFVESGVYKAGVSPYLDRAIKIRKRLIDFINQGQSDKISIDKAFLDLENLLQVPS